MTVIWHLFGFYCADIVDYLSGKDTANWLNDKINRFLFYDVGQGMATPAEDLSEPVSVWPLGLRNMKTGEKRMLVILKSSF